MLVTVKQSALLRCLVLLLSIALGSGNAHAALHMNVAHDEPCPEEHAVHHHDSKTAPNPQHQHGKDKACCCDCLGCTSTAYLAPELSSAPAEPSGRVHYDALPTRLSGRALLPESPPPRPGTLN